MVHTTTLTLTAPAPYDHPSVLNSHRWVELLPNVWLESEGTVQRTERLPSGTVVDLEVRAGKSVSDPALVVSVEGAEPLGPQDEAAVRAAVARMFRLDEDLSEFYALCAERGEPWDAMCAGQARILRSPTIFEDAVKTLCTVNANWGGTRAMVRRLVGQYGEPSAVRPDRRAFPTAEAIAEVPIDRFAQEARLGFRAPYVHGLATSVATGVLDPEAWQTSTLPTEALRREMLSVKGIGPYSAASLLMFLGRYDELAVDTAFRAVVSRKYFGGEQPSDRDAKAVYAGWGRWKYLAFWYDITSSIPEG